MRLKLLQPGVLSTNTTPQLGASLSTRTTGFSSGLIKWPAISPMKANAVSKSMLYKMGFLDPWPWSIYLVD